MWCNVLWTDMLSELLVTCLTYRCDTATFSVYLCLTDNGSTVEIAARSHNNKVVRVTFRVCNRGGGWRMPETYLTLLIILLMETGWLTRSHGSISRPEQRLMEATVYHTTLFVLDRGTDNLSLTDEVDVRWKCTRHMPATLVTATAGDSAAPFWKYNRQCLKQINVRSLNINLNISVM